MRMKIIVQKNRSSIENFIHRGVYISVREKQFLYCQFEDIYGIFCVFTIYKKCW